MEASRWVSEVFQLGPPRRWKAFLVEPRRPAFWEVRNSGDTSSLKTGTISEDGFLQTQVLEGEFPK